MDSDSTQKTSLPYRIPDQWQAQPAVQTRTELLHQRRQRRIPDPSFDLDGDGTVGGKDYLISKLFDQDQDGKLNAEERKKAGEALRSGCDAGMVWGCESSGINRSFRIIQKRGQAIIDENFTGMLGTYPEFLRANAAGKTLAQLKEERKTRSLQESEKISKELIKDFRIHVPIEKIVDYESFNASPNFPSLSAKKQKERLEARVRCGLGRESSQTREIPLRFSQSPRFTDRTSMMSGKKRELVEDLNRTANFDHKLDVRRLLEREEAARQPESDGKTYATVKNRQRSLDFEYNSETFRARPLGVHGIELPKFQDNRKEYWGKEDAGLENSQRKLIQTRKLAQSIYRGNPERMVINDSEDGQMEEALQKYFSHRRVVYIEPPVAPKPGEIEMDRAEFEVYQPKRSQFTELYFRFRGELEPTESKQGSGRQIRREDEKFAVGSRRERRGMAQRLIDRTCSLGARIKSTGF